LKALGIWAPLTLSMGRTLVKLGDLRITGATLSATLLIFMAVALVSRLMQALLAFRVYPRVGVARGEAYALNRLLHYALMAGALLLALNTLGLSPASLALVLGGLSVGIGFGLQDIANNIASGLIMLTSRQVRQGDVITVGDRMGTVREVNLRSTVVTTPDNVDLLIPNSKLLGDTVINWTHSSTSVRSKVPFGVSYDSNPREVMELALTIGRAHPEVLAEPEPAVWLLEMADNSVNFELYVWVDIAKSVRPQVVTEIYCRLFEELQARDIQIPYPQRDLHLRSGVPWDELIGALKSRGDGRLPDGREPRNGQQDAATPHATEGR
ncbi:MAG: mechanosensitive ion channel family protein, partial [Actinomycetota bacterium]